MSYKTELQSNNTDLQTILGKVNALPSALDTSDATAGAGDILTGKDAYVKGVKVAGSMPNNGAVSQALNAGGSFTIPAGYHNGSGKVTANSLASQTSATAAAADIASGKTAWVNGTQVTGTAGKAPIIIDKYLEGNSVEIPEAIGCTVLIVMEKDFGVQQYSFRYAFVTPIFSHANSVMEGSSGVSWDKSTGTLTLTSHAMYNFNATYTIYAF